MKQFRVDIDISGVNFECLRVNIECFLIPPGFEFLVAVVFFKFQKFGTLRKEGKVRWGKYKSREVRSHSTVLAKNTQVLPGARVMLNERPVMSCVQNRTIWGRTMLSKDDFLTLENNNMFHFTLLLTWILFSVYLRNNPIFLIEVYLVLKINLTPCWMKFTLYVSLALAWSGASLRRSWKWLLAKSILSS